MAIHVQEMTTDVTVETLTEGDMPLNAVQLDKLVKLVLRRLQEQQRHERDMREATTLRREASPGSPVDE